jgi:hypothetical protein
MKMVDLYWIATNNQLDLSIRYGAARQMQRQRIPEPVKRVAEPYDRDEVRTILHNRHNVAVSQMLNRSHSGIKSKRYRMKKNGV